MTIFCLLKRIGINKKEIVKYGILEMACAVGLGLIAPILVDIYARFIDEVINSILTRHISGIVIEVFLILIVLKVIEQILITFFPYIQDLISIDIEKKVQKNIIQKIRDIEKITLKNESIQKLIHRIDFEKGKMAEGIQAFFLIFQHVIAILGYLYVIREVGIFFVIILFSVILVVMRLSYYCSNNQYEYIFDYSETDRKVDYIDSLMRDKNTLSEIRIFQAIPFFKRIYIENMDRSIDLWNRQIRKTKPIEHVWIPLLGDAFLFITYVILFIALIRGKYSIGFFIAFISASLSTIQFVTITFPKELSKIMLLKKQIDDLNELTNLPIVKRINIEKENILNDIYKIRFENVYFRYPGSEEYVLENFCYEFIKGKHYAIIGENGAGKTTLVKLILGLYHPEKGNIYINDQSVTSYNSAQLCKKASVILQNFTRYEVTVEQFISISENSEFDMQRADEIAEKFGLFEMIHELENSYKSILGKEWDKGIDVSGGQWQKLALLRLFYEDRPLQILDEPTASLDPISESNLYQQFIEISEKNKIILFISHRLASTKFADDIILIDDGKVVEHGTHEQLIDKKGKYYKMYTEQSKWYI